jgi:hypothetical protein
MAAGTLVKLFAVMRYAAGGTDRLDSSDVQYPVRTQMSFAAREQS